MFSQSSSASRRKMRWHFVHIVGRLRYGRGGRMGALYERARCPRAMGTGQAVCAAIGCLEDVAQDACNTNESDQYCNGWVGRRVCHCVRWHLPSAFVKRLLPALATESCGMLAGEQQHLVQHGFVQWVLSKVRQKPLLTHSPCAATVRDLVGSARRGEPFGATKYENISRMSGK